MKKLFLPVLAGLLVGGMVLAANFYISGDATINVGDEEAVNDNITLGAQSGPDHYFPNTFYETIRVGGTVYSTSTTATAATLVSSEINEKTRLIEFTPNAPTLALTIMASTSMPWLGNEAGMTKEIMMHCATSSTAAITLTAGTGIELQEDQGGVVILNEEEYAKLTFMRENNSDVLLAVTVYQVGD